MRRDAAGLLALTVVLLLLELADGAVVGEARVTGGTPGPGVPRRGGAVVQLQGYPRGRLDALAAGGYDLAVVDLARDAGSDWFTRGEVRALARSGTAALAYFEIAALEDFRPDYADLRRDHPDLFLNGWAGWPGETFVRYWDPRWWDLAIRPRVDRAVAAGFAGVFLDAVPAYEEIDLALVPGETRESLAIRMVALIARIAAYGRAAVPGFRVVPNNAPELQQYPGYLDAVDGISMESLFYPRTGVRCTEPYCATNLEAARALRARGKFVLAIDYTDDPEETADACARYRAEGFVGYVTAPGLDVARPACPSSIPSWRSP